MFPVLNSKISIIVSLELAFEKKIPPFLQKNDEFLIKVKVLPRNERLNVQICSQCGSQNNPSSRFCTECGYSFQGLKGKILAKKKRITFQSKKMLETLKENVNNQITSYLDRLEEPDPHIGNVRIPDNRKDSIKNALMSFQQRIGSDSIQEVEDSPEFKEWLANLEHTIDTQKCNVCFMSWQGSETIVVCRHCQSGGHKDHLETWIKTRKMCPLCRREISLQDLASIDLSSNSK